MKKLIISVLTIILAGCGGANKEYIKQQNSYRERVADFFDKGTIMRKVDEKTLGNYTVSYDDLDNLYFLHPHRQYFSLHSKENNCGSLNINPYLALYEGNVTMRFLMKYSDSDWLFIKSLKLYTDKKTYNYTFKYGAIKTKAAYNKYRAGDGGVEVTETIDTSHYKLTDIIKDIPQNASITLRLRGERTCTYVIHGETLNNIRTIKYIYSRAKNKI